MLPSITYYICVYMYVSYGKSFKMHVSAEKKDKYCNCSHISESMADGTAGAAAGSARVMQS